MQKTKYSYPKAFIFATLFPIFGFVVEVLTPSQGIEMPASPINIYTLLIYILFIVALHIFFSKKMIINWLSSIQIAISSIVVTTLLIFIMALVPQTPEAFSGFIGKAGFAHMANNWAMIFSVFLLCTSLGLVTIKRLTPFNKKNIGFFLNHFGLWLVVVSATLGSGDLKRLTMTIGENQQPEWRATDKKMIYELGIAIKLLDFKMEEYNPEIALINTKNGNVIIDDKNKVFLINENEEYFLHNNKIKIEKFMSSAVFFEGNYVEYFDYGAVPVAKISIYSDEGEKINSGWVSAASHMQSPQTISLDSSFSVGLLQPQPKKYTSDVELFAKDGTIEKVSLEVNKPHKFKGWKIYQLSYDEAKGKWSEISVLELVRDPWLPVVYVGIFMVLIGSFYLFWVGNFRKEYY